MGALLEYAGAFQLSTTYVLSVSEARISDGAPGGFPLATEKHTHKEDKVHTHTSSMMCLSTLYRDILEG